MLGRDASASDAACAAAGERGVVERIDGVLRMDACFLEGLQADADLYLRGRYAAHVAAARARGPLPAAVPPLREGVAISRAIPWDG